MALRWSGVAGSREYRVDWSAHPNFSAQKSLSETSTATELTGLASSHTYYVRVLAIAANGTVGKRSTTLKVSTLGKGGLSELAPERLAASARSTTSLTFSWSAVNSKARYRLQYGVSPSFSGALSITVAGPTARITNVAAGGSYYVRVRVIDSEGIARSQYSRPLKVSTMPYPHSPVTGLRSTASATTAIATAWTAKAGAYRYRIRYSTSKAMTGPQIRYSNVNRLELTALRANTTYYLQVRVVTANLDALSAYSRPVALRTSAASGFVYLPPADLSLTQVGSTSVQVAWASRAKGVLYQVQASAPSKPSTSASSISSELTTQVRGLSPQTDYRVSVRVISASGKAQSPYSTALAFRSEPAGRAVLRVAAYNVRCHYCSDTPQTNELPWTERRGGIVATIKAQHPDVVGLQEASQTRLIGSDGKVLKDSQLDDLLKRLGSPYRATNPYRYNCADGYSSSKCKAKYRGASKGTKIIYNSRSLKMTSEGTVRLTSPKGKYRYAVWAKFADRATGKSFFFVNTHLEWEKDLPGSTYFFGLREAQAHDLVAMIKDKSAGLPVVIAGDFNSSKKTQPANAPYDIVTAAGYVDPLGNPSESTKPEGATVKNRIRTNYNSFNGYKLDPPKSSNVNGVYVDYLFTSPSLTVSEWETVLNLDSSGRFVGVIPSDHNMIRATIELP